MHLFDLHQDFFRPLWRRILIVALCLGWGLFEFANGILVWGILFSGLGVYAVWQFFLSGWPEPGNGADAGRSQNHRGGVSHE